MSSLRCGRLGRAVRAATTSGWPREAGPGKGDNRGRLLRRPGTGEAIPASAIGEPVGDVTLAAPRWVAATDTLQARCEVDGSIAPVDTAGDRQPINFRVWLPADWNHRAVQQGGGGMNGSIPDLSGARYQHRRAVATQLGFVTYGSDSGHQSGGQRGPGRTTGAGGAAAQDWALNDEAMKNLGYTQLKKTHDAAMVLIERVYGERPRYNYFTGTSQGGREALTVAQRYPADYDGIIANVPIVNFSSLMLAPELIRIQEKPLANWVTRAKVNAIRGEFMRQCDGARRSSPTASSTTTWRAARSSTSARARRAAIPGPRSAARTTSIRIPATRPRPPA